MNACVFLIFDLDPGLIIPYVLLTMPSSKVEGNLKQSEHRILDTYSNFPGLLKGVYHLIKHNLRIFYSFKPNFNFLCHSYYINVYNITVA